MSQGSRPERVGEEIRQEMSVLLAREVHDPGLGFVTITRVRMSPDLQQARIYYTLIGDERAKKDTERALQRASPFLRRQIAGRVKLRRVPELSFEFDKSVEHQDRIERILLDLAEERKAREAETGGSETSATDAEPTPTAKPDESDGHS